MRASARHGCARIHELADRVTCQSRVHPLGIGALGHNDRCVNDRDARFRGSLRFCRIRRTRSAGSRRLWATGHYGRQRPHADPENESRSPRHPDDSTTAAIPRRDNCAELLPSTSALLDKHRDALLHGFVGSCQHRMTKRNPPAATIHCPHALRQDRVARVGSNGGQNDIR